jgi:hypothetical protein
MVRKRTKTNEIASIKVVDLLLDSQCEKQKNEHDLLLYTERKLQFGHICEDRRRVVVVAGVNPGGRAQVGGMNRGGGIGRVEGQREQGGGGGWK